MRAPYDIEEGDFVRLERWPTIMWRVMVVQHDRPFSWTARKRWKPRARIEYESGNVWDFFQSDRWEPLEDLHKLNAMEVIAMASQ